jgi:hypothetical protein
MLWKKPHISKIYEALTVIADDRIEIDGNNAVCYSEDGNKVFNIKYDPKVGSLMSNDSAAYYTRTLSYPMIAYLMMIGTVHYDRKLKNILRKIDWEDIYKNFKNDYDKSIKFVLGELKRNGDDVEFIRTETKKIYDFVCKLDIKTFGEFQKPQKGSGF